MLLGCDPENPRSKPASPTPQVSQQADDTTNPSSDADPEASDPQPAQTPGETIALEAGDPSSEQVLARTFDDIKFDIEPDAPFFREMLTEEIESLNGKQIRIRGYMLPTPRSKGIKEFVLLRDNQECCFGPGAALYDCILIEMLPGKTTEFSLKPIAVEGTFRIDEFLGLDGRHLAIYRLECDVVE